MAVRIALSLGFGGRRLGPSRKGEMMMGSNFSPGTAVEMNPDEERLFNAWFPAIYLGQLGIDSFLLQCEEHNGGGSMAVECTNDIFELSMITRLDLKGEKHNGTGVFAQVAKDKGSEDATVEEDAVHSAVDIDKGITSITVGSSNPAGISKQQSEVKTRSKLV